MPTIIQSLIKRHNLPRRLVRALVLGLGSLIFAYGSFSLGKWWDKSALEPNREKQVVESLITSDILKNQNAGIFYLKKNPFLLNKLSNDFSVLKELEKRFFRDEPKKSSGEELELQNEHRVRLKGIDYFAANPLGKEIFFISQLRMIFDSEKKCLYEFEGNRLKKAIGGIEKVLSLPEKAYFLQGDNIYSGSSPKGEFILEQTIKEKPFLGRIEGKPFVIALSKIEGKVLGPKNSEKSKMNLSLKYLYNYLKDNEMELSPEKSTKIVFKNNCLYLNDEDNIYIVKGSKVQRIAEPFLPNFISYLVRDIDGDNRDELIISQNNETVKVYKEGKEESSFSTDSNILLRDDMPYRWLNPSKLKKDVRPYLDNRK